MATYTDNYTMTKPTYAEQADISVINANMDIIDNVMHSSQISLAPAYDINETYNTGDIVMYELLMYRCLEDNVTGAWDSTKWTRTTAGEESGGGADLDIYGEASGTAEASFSDGAEASLVECIVEIEATQSGSGTPSPSNVRPIVGRSEVNITVSDGETDNVTTIPLDRTVYGGTLDVTRGVLTVDRGYVEYDGSSDEDWRTVVEGYLRDFYINIPLAKSFCELICNIAERDGDGQTPNNIFISATKNFNWYIGNTIGIDNVADFKTWLSNNPLQLVYELATPQTFTLTKEQIQTLLGQNYVSHDGGGTISLVYVKGDAPIKPNPTGADIPLKGIEIDGEKFSIPSGEMEIIPITAGDGTTVRTFTFSKTPKFIKIYWEDTVLDGGWATDLTIVWGQPFSNYMSHPRYVSYQGIQGGLASVAYSGNTMIITGENAFGACNSPNGSGLMYIQY